MSNWQYCNYPDNGVSEFGHKITINQQDCECRKNITTIFMHDLTGKIMTSIALTSVFLPYNWWYSHTYSVKQISFSHVKSCSPSRDNLQTPFYIAMKFIQHNLGKLTLLITILSWSFDDENWHKVPTICDCNGFKILENYMFPVK